MGEGYQAGLDMINQTKGRYGWGIGTRYGRPSYQVRTNVDPRLKLFSYGRPHLGDASAMTL